jgi:hypothetical protein
MILTDNDKLSIALEIMGERDVEKFEAVCSIAEKNDIDVYETLAKFELAMPLNL